MEMSITLKIRRALGYLALCILVPVLLSCNSSRTHNARGYDIGAPVNMPEKFSQTGSEELPEKWWTALGDPRLDSLIEAALADNLTLQSTWDKLEQSHAVAKKSGADLSPSLDATAGVSESYSEPAGSSTGDFSNSYSLGLAASYELDLWGRLSNTRNAAESDFLASKEDLHAAAISLSSEVAMVWYDIVEKRGQMELIDKQIMRHEDSLEIVTVRFRQGQVPSTDVLQQRQSLEAAREAKIKVEMKKRVLEHRLAVLLGKAPGTLTIPEGGELPELPPMPVTGIPAELIMKKRPDTMRAFYKVYAADERLAAAISNKYPRISLSANITTVGSGDSGSTKLFENWLATLAGNILIPIFDAGSREAEVDRTRAVRSEQLNRYGQVTLNALKDVEDALTREAFQLQRLKSLEKQYELSLKSVDLTRERYTFGGTDFLRFMTTLLGHHSLERTRLTAKRELLEYRIDLYRALGGSWAMERTVAGKEKSGAEKSEDKEGGREAEPLKRGENDVRE